MLEIVKRVFEIIKNFFSVMDRAHRSRVTELTAYEERELENIFVLLLLGSLAGIPSPPAFIAVELFPYMEHELKVLEARSKEASDALSELAGLLDMD